MPTAIVIHLSVSIKDAVDLATGVSLQLAADSNQPTASVTRCLRWIDKFTPHVVTIHLSVYVRDTN